MATITQVRDAIAARLQTITSLNVYATVADSVMVPAAIVGTPATIEYDYTFSAANLRLTIPVRILAARVQEDFAQDTLDAYISYSGASSIPAAFATDPMLNNTALTSRITEARNYGVYEVEGIPYLGVEFVLEVIT
jgi:hypothetical protein